MAVLARTESPARQVELLPTRRVRDHTVYVVYTTSRAATIQAVVEPTRIESPGRGVGAALRTYVHGESPHT